MRRIKEVDGLRGIAIALVLAWHFFPDVSPPDVTIVRWVLAGLRLTWSGVDLFFVISGFLIGGILVDNRESPNYYRTFYVRRFFRIVPAYAAVCAAVGLAALTFPSGPASARLFNDLPPFISLATFTQNFWFAAHHTFGGMALAPVWSLGVEEQFYLTLPFTVRHTSRRALVFILLASVVLAPLIRGALFITGPQGWFWSQLMMPARADAFAIGFLVALAMRDRGVKEFVDRRSGLLAAIFLGAAAALVTLTYHRLDFQSLPFAISGYSSLAIIYGAVLLVAVRTEGRWLNRVLSASPLRALGSIAYGTYLLHTFVWGSLFVIFAGHTPWPHTHSLTDLGITALALAITFAIAAASWRWYELPLLAIGHRSRY